jgi:hypothetical protein
LDFVSPKQGAALALHIDWFLSAACTLFLNIFPHYCAHLSSILNGFNTNKIEILEEKIKS